jgi:predicted transglutaminase-like protease
MELRDVNYKVDNLINKSLNLLKSELLVEIKIKEEISEIYINAFEKIRVDLNRLRNVFLENKEINRRKSKSISSVMTKIQ